MRLKYAGRVSDLDRSGNRSVEEGASAIATGSRANPRSYLVKKRLRARAECAERLEFHWPEVDTIGGGDILPLLVNVCARCNSSSRRLGKRSVAGSARVGYGRIPGHFFAVNERENSGAVRPFACCSFETDRLECRSYSGLVLGVLNTNVNLRVASESACALF